MQNISMSDAELLKYAIEHGMIDTTYVQDMIEMQKRKEILEIKCTPCQGQIKKKGFSFSN